jgi:hypothetical protein
VEEPSTSSLREEHTNRDYENPLDWLIDSLTLDEGMMGGWKWLIPRNVLQRAGGWNESLTLNNDLDFIVRILLGSNGVRFAQDAIYFYRKGIESSLSGTMSRRAMKSAFETTKLGCQNLIARENSERIKRACADRWQWWLYHFYPEYSDLAELAENEIRRLGGSSKPLEGGRLLRALVPIIGWKAVRRLQVQVYRWGWSPILKWKEQRRIRFIDGRDR